MKTRTRRRGLLGPLTSVLTCALLTQCGFNQPPPSATVGDEQFDAGKHHPSESDGIVFIDTNGNGTRDTGEPGLANAVVFLDDRKFTVADSFGRYYIDVPVVGGMLWVRGQDGLDPGPFWIDLPAGAKAKNIPVRAASGSGDFSFVVASDTHAGIHLMPSEDQILGLTQAAGINPKPYFVTVTGDITQANKPEHFSAVSAAIQSIDIPFVPVPGNHDWYDGGAAYREHFGPPTYSFDSGGVHFVVLNDASSLPERLRFLDTDRTLVPDERKVVVLMHAPPREDLRLELESRDIDLLLTGHMHTNRVLQHDTFVEYNTQPLVMGGMDLTPAGFRVFRMADDGSISVDHRTTVNRSILRLVSPAADQTFAPCTARLILAVEPGQGLADLSAIVETMGTVPLSSTGGWNYESAVLDTLCTPGSYAVAVVMETADGGLQTTYGSISVGAPASTAVVEDWPMFQKDPAHSGATSTRLDFPLHTEWVASVGSNIHGGSPVVADGRVFLSVSDFGGGHAGGVVALDATTGARLWEHRVGFSVRNAAAVADDTLVFVSNDGTVHGVDVASGQGRWTYELAPQYPSVQRNIYSSPTVENGIAYLGGRYEFVAIEATSGDIVWSVEPMNSFDDLASHASAVIAGDMVIIPFNRWDGLFAFDRSTGAELWHTSPMIVQAAHGSPVVDGETVFVVNEMSRLTALAAKDSQTQWALDLEEGTFPWGYLAESTPVVHGTTLLVGTQRGGLHAVDTVNHEIRWSFETDTSLIRATHYHGESAAVTAAPVISGDYVWLPGQDGLLRVLDLVTGQQLWSLDLGVPVSSSPAIAGDLLIVASYDGSVRALRTAPVTP